MHLWGSGNYGRAFAKIFGRDTKSQGYNLLRASYRFPRTCHVSIQMNGYGTVVVPVIR